MTFSLMRGDGPVIVSVPHAGRTLPAGAAGMLRVSPEELLPLEDRHVDLLAPEPRRTSAAVLIAQTPRAWIDLNRREDEIDPAMVAGGWPADLPPASSKVRGGLGLIPRRLAAVGDIWRRPMTGDEIEARLAAVHRPYHQALRETTNDAFSRHGRAVLIDLHSMPPGAGADLVLGDRFGRSAAPEIVQAAVKLADAHGLSVARNRPYAGGHILERHGRPAEHVHALQLEVDRILYLQPDLATYDPRGVERLRSFVTDLAEALGRLDLEPASALAAE